MSFIYRLSGNTSKARTALVDLPLNQELEVIHVYRGSMPGFLKEYSKSSKRTTNKSRSSFSLLPATTVSVYVGLRFCAVVTIQNRSGDRLFTDSTWGGIYKPARAQELRDNRSCLQSVATHLPGFLKIYIDTELLPSGEKPPFVDVVAGATLTVQCQLSGTVLVKAMLETRD